MAPNAPGTSSAQVTTRRMRHRNRGRLQSCHLRLVPRRQHHHAKVARPAWARAILSHRVFTGLSRHHLAEVIVELADPWTAAHQAHCTDAAATHAAALPAPGHTSGWCSPTGS
jgi:hypothetical protein